MGVIFDVYKCLLVVWVCGVGVILIFEDLDELMCLLDCIVVIYCGEVFKVELIEMFDWGILGLCMVGYDGEKVV